MVWDFGNGLGFGIWDLGFRQNSETIFQHMSNPKHVSAPIENSKAFHANLTYNRWKSGTKKLVFSNRLGISYQESIHARDVNSVLTYGNKHMYRKRLTGFHLNQSKYTAVKKKQETRFLRACKQVFNMEKPNPPDLYRHRLCVAQKYRFLFLKSQFVNKPVKHLMYNHGLVSDLYGFRTPHYYSTANHANGWTDGRPIAQSHARLHSTYSIFPNTNQSWVQEYNPYPDMFIPHKYRDIIPKDPLYTNLGIYIVPGSCTWFTYMSNLHNNRPTRERLQARRRILRLADERIKRNEELLQQENELKIAANFYGTSVHTLPRRKRQIEILSDNTDCFHRRMTQITNDLKRRVDIASRLQLRIEMDSFENFFTQFTSESSQLNTRHARNFSDASDETSDDTKEIERCPKKRNTAPVTNNFFYRNEDRYKRNRPSEVPISDVNGPVWSDLEPKSNQTD
ncbi:hypothetical protein RhiirA4_517101 [Rhizophagus irregularis]|uniref:DUF8211 domain-containing protein n=1 Tax=Rhizophagus irregularis TaxID=588596 RepID=A0A2I1HMK6_9GLOM|nr:hypothetical protein RhiirA4_517101 [Rhizophagus irregularis]